MARRTAGEPFRAARRVDPAAFPAASTGPVASHCKGLLTGPGHDGTSPFTPVENAVEEECEMLLFEPAEVRNTGDVEHPTLTAPGDARA